MADLYVVPILFFGTLCTKISAYFRSISENTWWKSYYCCISAHGIIVLVKRKLQYSKCSCI